ncbi:hypothetical protein OZ664_06185 [Elizabethkingia sp. HX WHF]|uniref:hypothetical protein n=1 Tax=Elizabethkingia TaxID=308865 RepID=UPI00099921EB|nr:MULTISPECIES: hypothetical protein [Elizabethkingia]ATL42637.1 hypothetical protein CQS02_04600 [Elizabethkingia miricola]MCL1637182.1 hypothetical protein [Elizabethkingia bruuniana]MDX8563583.1 hypothetical protein [Elizabethkingia sp. HX WHF]OPC20034.1 hypothetical protein BAY00_11095 [Elizabethkingia bruuniana]
MIKIYSLLFLIFTGSAVLYAQKKPSPESSLYVGVQAGSPLFWGDLSSTGEKFRSGYGGGLFVGYRFTNWLAVEVNTDYITGNIGASKWQTNDLIDNQGVIRYTQGSYKLGDIYSKIRLSRYGLRLPVKVLKIFRSEGKFNLEIAPHLFFNDFSTGIYNIKTNQKLMDGTKPESMSYSVGGDLGFSYKIDKHTKLFLRSSFSWLNDDKYDGVITYPAWKENLMLYTTIGVSFDINTSKKDNNKTISNE